MSSSRSAASTPTAQRSLYPVPEIRLLPGREFRSNETARVRLPRPLARGFRRRSEPLQRVQDIGRASPAPASSTTCRCSSTRPPRCSTTCPPAACSCCTGRSRPRRSASGQRQRALPFLARDTQRHACRDPALPDGRAVLSPPPGLRAARARRGDSPQFAPLPLLAVSTQGASLLRCANSPPARHAGRSHRAAGRLARPGARRSRDAAGVTPGLRRQRRLRRSSPAKRRWPSGGAAARRLRAAAAAGAGHRDGTVRASPRRSARGTASGLERRGDDPRPAELRVRRPVVHVEHGIRYATRPGVDGPGRGRQCGPRRVPFTCSTPTTPGLYVPWRSCT